MVLASFMDEMSKIAANVAASLSVGKPATLAFGSKPSSAMKTELKPTNYTTVNTETRDTGYGTAEQIKATPPPPVRA